MKQVIYTVDIEFSTVAIKQHHYEETLPACVNALLEDAAYFDDLAEVESITINSKK